MQLRIANRCRASFIACMSKPEHNTPKSQPNQSSNKLNAYRRQHAALRSHINWLEEEIRSLEKEIETSADATQSEVKPEIDPKALAVEMPEASDHVENSLATEKLAADLGKMRLGCALFAILAAALFLYLLFGLPYQIYN